MSLGRLGAATVGESGGRAMAPRIGPVWSGAVVAGPAYPVRVRPATTSPSMRLWQAHRPARCWWSTSGHSRPRVLRRGPGHRRAGSWPRRAGHRRLRPRHRRTRAIGFPRLRPRSSAARREQGGRRIGRYVGRGRRRPEMSAGDWIVGDIDGVVIVPATALAGVIATGRSREAKERSMFDTSRRGDDHRTARPGFVADVGRDSGAGPSAAWSALRGPPSRQAVTLRRAGLGNVLPRWGRPLRSHNPRDRR